MFGKILRAGKGSHGLKYKIDVQITQLENLPTSIKKCRVVWARSAKMQITDVKDVRGGVASFKQTLTQVTTIFQDKAGKAEVKEYEFKIQVPGKTSSDATITIGKATLDMAKFCTDQNTSQNAMVPITFKVGATTTGYLKMVVSTVFLGDANEDGLTEVSGITGLTSDHGSVREQDLEGFHDDESKFGKRSKSKREDASSSAAGTSGRSTKLEASRSGRRKPLPPTAEEDASDMEDEEEPSPPPAKASRKKPPPPPPPPPEDDEDDEGGANPFAKKVSKPPAKKPPPKVWEDDEDVSPLSSDVSDSEAPRAKYKPSTSKAKSQEPAESLDDMKSSLFATKKSGGGAAGKTAAAAGAGASSSKAAASAAGSSRGSKAPSQAPPADEDDDSLRNDLFSAKPKAGAGPSSSKAAAAAGGKAGKSVPPPPVEEDEDEDSMRGDLFAAKPKASAAAANSKAASGKAAAAAAAAASTAAAASKSKTKSPPPPPQYDDEYDDDYGPSSSAASPPPVEASRHRSRAAEPPPEPPAAKGSGGGFARTGSAKADTSKGGSSADLEQMRRRIAQLEEQLADEQAAKDEINKKMQRYVDKIADLEDQVAEGNVAELYAQMREMEVKYQAEIKELMDRHLADTEDMEERHAAEVERLQEEAASSGRAGHRAGELQRLEAELRDQEVALKSRTARIEAEQAAAQAARQSAEAKLLEANKMIDESLLVATKHQQENKGLNEEIARLKRQLEDAANWESNAAVATVAAATAAAGRRTSEDEEELEELREKLQELQDENERLQKLNETAARSANAMLEEVGALLGDLQRPDLRRASGSSPLDGLALGVQSLCTAYKRKSWELRELEARTAELRAAAAADARRTSSSGDPHAAEGAAPGGKVKPHELLSRIQQLTADSDALREELAQLQQAERDKVAAQQRAAELQRQVDRMASEREAVEQFKLATIAELRRQNDDLRSSLRSLSSLPASPVHGASAAEPAAGGAHTPVSSGTARAAFSGSAAARLAAVTNAADAGNWQEFESLVAQLKADRSDLTKQVELLKADKSVLERQLADGRSQLTEARTQVVDVRSQLAEVRTQLAELRSSRGAAAAAALAGTGSGGGRHSHQQQQRLEELEAECAQHQATVAKLEAQLAELSEADTIIRDWSVYADGLTSDKARLEGEVQELTRQLSVGAAAAAAAERRADAGEQRAEAAERRVTAAERKVETSDRKVAAAERRAEVAEQRAEAAERRAEAAEQRASVAERRADDAASRADEADSLAEAAALRLEAAEARLEAAEARAEEAEARAEAAAASTPVHVGVNAFAFTAGNTAALASAATPQSSQQPADSADVAELRHDIARLEAALSGLRVQLVETQSRAPSVEGDMGSTSPAPGPESRRRQRHRRLDVAEASSHAESQPSLDRGAGGGADEGAVARLELELEQLRGRNASLEAVVAGLRSSLAVATQQLDEAGEAERQLEDLRSRLADATQANEELESSLLSLRSEAERAPLVDHAAAAPPPPATIGEDLLSFDDVSASWSGREASPRAADGPGSARAAAASASQWREEVEALEALVLQLQNDRSVLTATVAGLRSEVERLQEDKAEAEETIARLSSEMEEMAEALEAQGNENERLSMECLSLRDQVEQFEEQQQGQAGPSAARARSGRSTDSGTRASSRGSSEERGSAAAGALEEWRGRAAAAERELAAARTAAGALEEWRGRAAAAERELAAARTTAGALEEWRGRAAAAERELEAARAAAAELARQLAGSSSGGGGTGFNDELAFGDDEDLAQGLKSLRAQIRELQRQSRLQQQQQPPPPPARSSSGGASGAAAASAVAAAAAAEAQLSRATARLTELEQLLEDAEIENQHLTEQLEECLTAGRAGPGSVGSAAEECQSSYGGVAGGGGTSASNAYSYGHANTLTLSALEQRLAMAEARRDELASAVEDASATNLGLEAEVKSLRKQLAGLESGSSRDLERSSTQVPARSRGARAAADADDAFKRRISELEAANSKLEGVCEDLEEKALVVQEQADKLRADLEASRARTRELEGALAAASAAAAAAQKRYEEEAGGGGAVGRQGKDKLADLEARAARLARDKAALENQLSEERAARQELEETLKDKLDRSGDDEAADTVAAFEIKYNRLKERYKMLEESSQEEIDELQDQLTGVQAQVVDLQRQVKQLQQAQGRNNGAAAAAAAAAGAEELQRMREENAEVVDQLVAKTMRLAEMSEHEIQIRREMTRLREVNMRLAQKATTLEAQAALAQQMQMQAAAAGKPPAKGGKK